MTSVSNLRFIHTSHGSLAVEESGEGGPPLLMIHGNSSCRQVFQRQMGSRLTERRRLIALDLPGHGQSSDAPDPARSYTLPGLANSVAEALDILRLNEVVVLGWSLGGHIAIELMSRIRGIQGLMITGAPPVQKGRIADGFVFSSEFGLASREDFSKADAEAFARKIFGEPVEPFLREAIGRADGRFRRRLFEGARAGEGVDQRLAVETSSVPIAVVNGELDPLVNLDYVETIEYANLWRGRCHRISDGGHAPFWRRSSEFNSILAHFLNDLDQAERRD